MPQETPGAPKKVSTILVEIQFEEPRDLNEEFRGAVDWCITSHHLVSGMTDGFGTPTKIVLGGLLDKDGEDIEDEELLG